MKIEEPCGHIVRQYSGIARWGSTEYLKWRHFRCDGIEYYVQTVGFAGKMALSKCETNDARMADDEFVWSHDAILPDYIATAIGIYIKSPIPAVTLAQFLKGMFDDNSAE